MELSNEFGHEVCPVGINLFLEIDAMLRDDRQKGSANVIIERPHQSRTRDSRLGYGRSRREV